MIKLLKPHILPICLFLFTFLLYVHHLSPGVYGGDTGDYLSAIAVHGVPHPSGYPLYTLLGIIISWLPIHQTLAWKVGLLSAFFSSLAVVLMYILVEKLLKNRFLATISALTLAFIFPFWLFAEVAEVFALHNFLLLLIFYLGLCLYLDTRIKYLYLLSFFTGLSFANHELTLLILPALSILIFAVRKKITISLYTVLTCIVLFLAGLLPYLYIPIAAAQHPPINWDNASTFSNFILLVTRGEYSWNGVGGNFVSSIKYLSYQDYISYITSLRYIFIIAFVFFGIVGTLRKNQYIILATTLITFFLFGPLFAYYWGGYNTDFQSAGIFEKFFTTSLIFLIVLMPYGMQYLGDFLYRMFVKFGTSKSTALLIKNSTFALCIFAPLSLFAANIVTTDLHNFWLGDKFGKDILTQLPKNSYLVEDTDDTIFFTTRYMQYVYGIRQDVTVVTTSDFERFVKGTRLIGQKNKPAGLKLEGNYVVGITNPIFNVIADYNDLTPSEQATAIPYGLLFWRPSSLDKPLSEEAYLHIQQPLLDKLEKSVKTMPSTDSLSQLRLVADIPSQYAQAFANTGAYLIKRYGDYKTAEIYFKKSLALNANIANAYEGLGDYSVYKNDCKAAKTYYARATDIGFLTKRFYKKLYTVVNSCLHDKVATQQLQYYFDTHRTFFGDILKK
jgi:hypothetical protein